MRHGQSEANVAGLIVSDPAIGCERFGLTEQGRQQVVASVTHYTGNHISRIISSDFLRTRQTASLAAETLGLLSPQIESGLRERFFGVWEGKSDVNYQKIWQQDQQADKQSIQGIETVHQVRQRGLNLIEKLEQQFQNEVILLVSHGDMLQILLTAFVGIPADQHRTLPHHDQAEIKHLISQGDEWPFA